MTRCIMVQGTMSGAGKSLLTAGLCRIFKEDGYRVAPFKSQNMALNSYITADGLEMGRAQVVQAQAAGKEPDVRMNPILLKPSSDVGSQLIVNGKVYGDYKAKDYFKMKKSLIPEIQKAYDSLAEENDILVIEGAGSPAEINLKDGDIVNMGLAKLVNAPVLLVGDIDRGGVFAQLYGTVELLEKEERERIIGLIINKFRGDVDILKPGLVMLEDKTRIPVLGVVPYSYAKIDEEDSLAPQLEEKEAHKPLDLAVIRLPRISNFTDFTPLEEHPLLGVRYVSHLQELQDPDLILLPGTKNTMGDLEWLRQSGLEMRIRQLAAEGKPVLGICGGYQMMGESLADPYCVEHGGEMKGMGLLPIKTVFTKEKTRNRARAKACGPFAGAELFGYEIHMGESQKTEEAEDFCLFEDGHKDGVIKGNCAGSYLHGMFDSGQLTARLAELLLAKKGIKAEAYSLLSHKEFQEQQLDLLAKELRESLDMEKIYEAMTAFAEG